MSPRAHEPCPVWWAIIVPVAISFSREFVLYHGAVTLPPKLFDGIHGRTSWSLVLILNQRRSSIWRIYPQPRMPVTTRMTWNIFRLPELKLSFDHLMPLGNFGWGGGHIISKVYLLSFHIVILFPCFPMQSSTPKKSCAVALMAVNKTAMASRQGPMAKVDFKQAKVGAYWDPTGYESTWGKGIGEGWHTVSYSMFGERRVYKYTLHMLREMEHRSNYFFGYYYYIYYDISTPRPCKTRCKCCSLDENVLDGIQQMFFPW